MEWIIGITTGVISGVLVGGLFYVLSGRQLSKEARELRRINGVVVRALRDMNAEIVFDNDGSPNRLNFHLKAETGHFGLTGGGAVLTHRDKDGNVISEA